MPIQPGKGYTITESHPGRCPSIPIIFQDRKVVVTPFRPHAGAPVAQRRLGSTMEFAGYDESLNPRRLRLLTRAAEHYLDGPAAPAVRASSSRPEEGPVHGSRSAAEHGAGSADECWYGWRPMTYDSKPIIDRCPSMPNVIIAAGHNMLGLTLATVTGRLAMELLTDRPPHVPVEPFALRRF